jgi:hypothetical protein
MAMTSDEAREIAQRLIQTNPKLKNVDMRTLVAKIMANEGMDRGPIQTPGGTSRESLLAGLLPPLELSPATPAPMQAGVPMEAPKPTAQIMPAVGGPVEMPSAAPPAEAPAAVRKSPSKFQPALDAAIYEMEQMSGILDQARDENAPIPEEAKLKIRTLNDRINRLKAYVAADEGAAVDPERLAIMERRAERIGREEELLKEAKQRSPWEALAKAGFAMAQGRKGEGFGGALSRGLEAGLEAYGSARKAAEAGELALGEKRDINSLSKIDALEKAREEARRMIDAGIAIDKQTMELANLTDEQIVRSATQGSRIESVKAAADKARTEANMAAENIQSEIDYRRAMGAAAGVRASGVGDQGVIPKGMATVYNALASQAKSLRDAIRDPYTSKADRKTYNVQLAAILSRMNGIEQSMGLGGGNAPFAGAGSGPFPAKPTMAYVPGKGVIPVK